MDVLTEDVRNSPLMELLNADNFVLFGESLNEFMDKYWRWKNAVEGKGMSMNVDKTKGVQLLRRKVVFLKSILVVSVVSRLVVILFSVRYVRDGFMVVILMSLGRWVYYHVRTSLSVEHALVIIVQ